MTKLLALTLFVSLLSLTGCGKVMRFELVSHFAGMSGIDQITDSSVRISWEHVSDADYYQVYDITSGTPTLLAQVNAPTSSYTVQGLSAATTYTFYVKAFGGSNLIDDNTNEHTVVTAALTCPPNYVRIAANATFGTDAFCVMKFEAKDVAGVPTSIGAGLPWTNISQVDAHAACNALNPAGSVNVKYDLISNPEWMAIAFNIENTGVNWNAGMINRGHSDNDGSGLLAVTNEADDYDGTGNMITQAAGLGWEQKRTHTLANGEVIWDFAGNAWEWTDWMVGGGLDSAPTGCAPGYVELPSVACGDLVAVDYQSDAGTLTSSEGVGVFYGGSGGAARRGGSYDNTTSSGIYALFLNASPTSGISVAFGFRCVYRS